MAGCTIQKSTAGRSHRHTLEASGLSLWSKTGWGVGESRTSKNPPTLSPSFLSHAQSQILLFPPALPSPLQYSPFNRLFPSPTFCPPLHLHASFLPPLSPIPTFDSHLSLPVSSPRLPPLPPLTPSTRSPFPHSPFHSSKPISLTHPPPHASPPLQLRHRHVPSPARTSFAGNPGDVTTRSALLPALSRKDAKVVTCPEASAAAHKEVRD